MSGKKYPRSEAIRSNNPSSTPMYVTWNGRTASMDRAMTAYSKAVDEFNIIRAKGAWYQDLSGLTTYTSGRPGLDRADYGAFRPNESIPEQHNDIMLLADAMYHRVGMIRNIIDLMGDFACQGIRLVHPNKKIEKFYRSWFKKVNGVERSERFLNILYRMGNVIINIQTATIKNKTKDEMYRATGADLTIEPEKVKKKEIPWRYTFLNPATVDVVGGSLASFVGNPTYIVTIPATVRMVINGPKDEFEKALVNQLPEEVKLAAQKQQYYPLDSEKLAVYHYKKDDWSSWAKPMIYAIMSDVVVLEKLKLADMAALDGAISNIRIFKLGNLEYKIAPTEAAAAKLASILESNVGGGTMDLIWGPDIELLESKTTVHQFLGEEKYKPHLQAIYSGLGIPPTLTGTFGTQGTTNNFISLKTLIQRLEYGRHILMTFWNQEIVKVQKAMGFRLPAKIEFEIANLGDEVAEKSLLVQLADRNLISDEIIQHRFGADPEMETIRLKREMRERSHNKRPEKSGPFHDPQFGIALKKVALQSGILSPEQVGLSNDEKREHLRTVKSRQKNALQVKNEGAKKIQDQNATKVGLPGRPKNAKDSKQRKTKTFSPKSKAVIELWAKAAQSSIADVVTPQILSQFGRKNVRNMTDAEFNYLEQLKFDILYHHEPCGLVDHSTILAALDKGGSTAEIQNLYNNWIQTISNTLNRALTMDERRSVQTCLYATYHGELNNG